MSPPRPPRVPAHAVNWLNTLYNFNEALPLRQKWHKLTPLLPADNLEAPEGQGVYLVFALVNNEFLTAVHAGSADAEHGLKSRLRAHAQAAEHGAQGVEWSKQDGNFFVYALGTQNVKLLYSYSCVTPMEGAQGYEARLLWQCDFFGNGRLNGGFGVEGARLGAPPTTNHVAEAKQWVDAFNTAIKRVAAACLACHCGDQACAVHASPIAGHATTGARLLAMSAALSAASTVVPPHTPGICGCRQHLANPELCKTFDEQMKFSLAEPEGEAAAVLTAIQRRSARLLQLAEDLQLACNSARNMNGYQVLQLKQQLAAWNDAADDRHAVGEAGLEAICRGIEQLLEGGSAASEHKLAEEGALNNKVDAASLLPAMNRKGSLADLTKSPTSGLSRNTSTLDLGSKSPTMSRNASALELGSKSPTSGMSRNASTLELGKSPPVAGLARTGSTLDLKSGSAGQPVKHSSTEQLIKAGSPSQMSRTASSADLASSPRGSPRGSLRGRSSAELTRTPSAGQLRRGSIVGSGAVSAPPAACRPAASKMSMAIAERFVGRAAWEADCWQLYLAVSEAAIAGSTRGFPFTVTADQLVDAYALNDHQASSLRDRLDRAKGEKADDTLRLCCYLGSMRTGATEHERLHQQLLELEACNGKKVRRRHSARAVVTPRHRRARHGRPAPPALDAAPGAGLPGCCLRSSHLPWPCKHCASTAQLCPPPPPWRPAGLLHAGQPGSLHCRHPGGRQEGLPGSCRPAAGRAQTSGAQVLPPGGPVQQVQGHAHAGRAVPCPRGRPEGRLSEHVSPQCTYSSVVPAH
jgi:hypothetical protein